jgi:hypothetical protein
MLAWGTYWQGAQLGDATPEQFVEWTHHAWEGLGGAPAAFLTAEVVQAWLIAIEE